MGQYRIITSPHQRTMFIKNEGIFAIADADQFMLDFNRELEKISATEYTLDFDCTHLGVTSPATLYKLEQCFMLYYQANFKKIIFDTGGNAILYDQIAQLSKKYKLTRYELI